MDQRLSAKKLQQTLMEMKEISRMDFLLFSEKGKELAATVDTVGDDVLSSVRMFSKSLAESQVVQNWMFFRVEVEGHMEYILLCSQNSGMETSYIVGRMAVNQIRNLCISAKEPMDKVHFLRQVLNDEILPDKIEERVHQLHLRPGRFMLYVIRFSREQDSVVLETLKNLFVMHYDDYLVEIDDTKVVLIKNVQGIDGGEYEQYADTIVDNIQAEAMTNVWIGYGDVADSFTGLSAAYKEACMALKIGKIFLGDENVFRYDSLGIGRLIYQLPRDMCELFLHEVLGENADLELDEETLNTINHLFNNNLNISETARQLYIHRNTLVYRLERIEKKLGLDIRSFEDAMLFKIAMMVRAYVNSMGGQ